jgi:predicted SAM-dependent methyltransferase
MVSGADRKGRQPMQRNSIELERSGKKVLPYNLRRFLRQVRDSSLLTPLLKKWLQHHLKSEVKRRCAAHDTLRVVVGAGQLWPVVGAPNTNYTGWLMTDVGSLNVLDSEDWNYIFPAKSIDRILAEHVFEHLTEDQFRAFLRIVRGFLSPQGFVRVAVPDGFHPDPTYIEHTRPGGSGPGAEDHKILYNYLVFTRILAEENWEHSFLETFDEQGDFHRASWSATDGFVLRSAEYDPRNRECPLSYTSLIVECCPKAETTLGELDNVGAG